MLGNMIYNPWLEVTLSFWFMKLFGLMFEFYLLHASAFLLLCDLGQLKVYNINMLVFFLGWTKGSVRDPTPTSDIAKNYVYKLGEFSPNDLAFGVELGLKPNSKRVLKPILVFFFLLVLLDYLLFGR